MYDGGRRIASGHPRTWLRTSSGEDTDHRGIPAWRESHATRRSLFLRPLRVLARCVTRSRSVKAVADALLKEAFAKAAALELEQDSQCVAIRRQTRARSCFSSLS
jgi:hypothetical protein